MGIVRRKLILVTKKCHCPDLGSDHDWLKQIFLVAWQIRRTTKIWVAVADPGEGGPSSPNS